MGPPSIRSLILLPVARASVREIDYTMADGVDFVYGVDVAEITKDGPMFKQRTFDEEGNVTAESEPKLYGADTTIDAFLQSALAKLLDDTLTGDDFYGRDAFMSVGKFLSSLPEGSTNKYAMVGFRCCNTLSENGSVARGVCEYDDNRHLTDVVERTEIMRQADKGNAICFKDENGEWIPLEETVPVSMNMWGFTPDYFEHSEAYFKEFLSDPKNMENLKAEFFIPLMVNKLINEGTATVEVLDTTSVWFGVTYAADRQATVERIAKLVADGVYPNKLF